MLKTLAVSMVAFVQAHQLNNHDDALVISQLTGNNNSLGGTNIF